MIYNIIDFFYLLAFVDQARKVGVVLLRLAVKFF